MFCWLKSNINKDDSMILASKFEVSIKTDSLLLTLLSDCKIMNEVQIFNKKKKKTKQISL